MFNPHFDTVADLSLTESDHRYQYSPYYLDYENGRVNVVLRNHIDESAKNAETTPPSNPNTIDYFVFFNDVLVFQKENVMPQNDQYYIWPNHAMKDQYGNVLGEQLPEWILEQMDPSQLETFKKAKNGDKEAQLILADEFKSFPKTPFGNGLTTLSKYWEQKTKQP